MAVQEEIAWQISEALRLKLTGEQKKKLRKSRPSNPDAYQEYLRGRYHWNNWTPGQLQSRASSTSSARSPRPELRARLRGPRRQLGAMAYYGFIPPDYGFPRAEGGGDEGASSSIPTSRMRMRRSASSTCSGARLGGRRTRVQDGDLRSTRSTPSRTPSTQSF